MKKINLTFPDKSCIQVENEIRPITLLSHFQTNGHKILAVRVNNEICSLDAPVNISAKLEPVYDNTKAGAEVFRRSLCFLLGAAAHNIYPENHLLVGHSLGYGYYYTMDRSLTPDEVSNLQKEMERLVKEDLPIDTGMVSYQDACQIFESLGLVETRKQLNYRCPSKIQVNTLKDWTDLYFGPLVGTTGLLTVFELLSYHGGFLLRFPSHNTPDELPPFEDQPKLFELYRVYKQWGKKLQITSAASLNQLIHEKKEKDFIDITETLQTKAISMIADQIAQKKSARIVLIAGPSSSGKTTTSKKLALQLQAIGYNPKVISLDNYYKNRVDTPKDEKGDYDYECLEALQVDLLNENLLDLFDGKPTKIPTYDFHQGLSYFKGDEMVLGPDDILIMEGIHGLNDKLTPLVSAEKKFKIYLSALTQLNLDDHNRIPTSDNRLLRRIVRDSNFRGKSAADTIAMWENVQKGERLHIFPFQNNADAILNTALDYEIPVLKVYAEPLLRCVNPNQAEYGEASRLLHFLNCFSQIPASSVPNMSIIREFIGGSKFHY